MFGWKIAIECCIFYNGKLMSMKKNNVIQFPNRIPPKQEGSEATQISEQLHINPGEVLDSYLDASTAQRAMGIPRVDELKASLQGLLKDLNGRLQ